MSIAQELIEKIRNYRNGFAAVVPFNASADDLLLMDFTENNKELTEEVLDDTERFSKYVSNQLKKANATYGIGGYDEHRTIYKRSELFSPSPSTFLNVDDGAKAPSRWEGEEEVDNLVKEETEGYRHADASVYGLLKEFALKHRSQPTEAEDVMWKILKTKKFEGYKFRRQHIIDRFIADFLCLKQKLVIEIDGLIHALPDHQISDLQRTERLNQLGFQVIRFSNEEVLHDTGTTLQKILNALRKLPEAKENNDLSSPTGGQGAVGQGAPRRLHLGVDIWGPVDVPVYAPMEGVVHSFAFNSAYGDYGATLILQHELDGVRFHTLFGHLSLKSIEDKREGQTIEKSEWIAAFGEPAENGHWPPHLHFQMIIDMQGWKGDYPGVCAYLERETYLANCPDGDLLLNMMQYAK